MYIEREIEATIDAKLKQGKVILVTGARQVGKTTTLKHHLGDSFNYVSLENPRDYLLAKEDAMLFFESKEPPPHHWRGAARARAAGPRHRLGFLLL